MMRTQSLLPLCADCGTALAGDTLACPQCGWLVYSEQLKSLSAQADEASRNGNRARAIGLWRETLSLLPAGSRQHQVITERIRQLEFAGAKPKTHAGRKGWLVTAIGLALLVLSKGKFLLLGLGKAKTLLSMGVFFGVYLTAFGWPFALGLVLSIYVHEMGHVHQLWRYGIAATAPMFIPGFGAYIRMKQRVQSTAQQARVGLAGPNWGFGAALVCKAVAEAGGHPVWLALAHTGAWINLFNLIPIWQLDGAHAFRAMTRQQQWLIVFMIGATYYFSGEGLLILLLLGAAFQAWRGTPAEEPDWWVFSNTATLVVGLTLLTVMRGI
jgi:Zn-dependent protease